MEEVSGESTSPQAPPPRSGQQEVAPEIIPRSLASPSFHLAEHINQERFSKIMADFNDRKHQSCNCSSSSGNSGTLQRTKMTTEDFQEAMSKLLGRPPDDPKIVLLCEKVKENIL